MLMKMKFDDQIPTLGSLYSPNATQEASVKRLDSSLAALPTLLKGKQERINMTLTRAVEHAHAQGGGNSNKHRQESSAQDTQEAMAEKNAAAAEFAAF